MNGDKIANGAEKNLATVRSTVKEEAKSSVESAKQTSATIQSEAKSDIKAAKSFATSAKPKAEASATTEVRSETRVKSNQ